MRHNISVAHPLTRRKVLATPLALALAARTSRAQGAPPNIVYIMADDLGYADLSCYGRRDYTTPNIDRLATEGMKFLQAYANSAVCSATRTALITGRYQYRLPVGLEEPLGTGNTSVGLPPEHPTLPSLLRKAGYGTTLIGKWHLGNLPDYGPLKSGYDHFWGFRSGAVDYFTHKSGLAPDAAADLWDDDTQIEQAGYLTNLLGDHAVKTISDYAAKRKPFLLSLHFNAPHWPWEGPDDEAESQRIRSLVDFDGGSLKTYARMVGAMDAQVGRVLQTLASSGIADNTIVIFTSDNGGERFADTWPFTGKKTELLEGGLRIPALVRWPGHIKAGSTTRSGRDFHGLASDAAGRRRHTARSCVSSRWHEPAADADAERRAGSAQALLALQRELAARDARRRHEVPQDSREHVPVQRRRRSSGARQPQESAAGSVPPLGPGLRELERDHVGGAASPRRRFHRGPARGSLRQ